MQIIDFRFLGHQRLPPLMTPGGLDPSATIISTNNKLPSYDVVILNFSADVEDIKKVVNCPMNDKTVPIKFWPQNQKMGAIVRRHSCIF